MSRRHISGPKERCNFCGRWYDPYSKQSCRAHDTYCLKVVQEYDRTWKRLSRMKTVSWFRPKIEGEGVYRAMNDANPLLHGFECGNLPRGANGFTDHDWRDLQLGKGLMKPDELGENHGHDRYGSWRAPDGRLYGYHANWRCGQVYFRLVSEAETPGV